MAQRLDVGGVIRRVFDIYVDQAPVLLPASAVVFVVTGIVAQLLVAASSSLAIVALFLDLVATTLFTGMVVELVADVQDGRRDHSPSQLLRAVTPVLGTLVLVGIVVAIGVAVGFILIVVPGLILLTLWSVAAPVVVLERTGVFDSLGRSRELVRGNGWQVFGVIFVLFFLILIVGSGVELAASSASSAAGLVASVVIGVLIGPIYALAQSVMYFDLRAAQTASTVEPPISGLPSEEPGPGESRLPPGGDPPLPA